MKLRNYADMMNFMRWLIRSCKKSSCYKEPMQIKLTSHQSVELRSIDTQRLLMFRKASTFVFKQHAMKEPRK